MLETRLPSTQTSFSTGRFLISKVKKWAGSSKTSVVNYTEVEGKSFNRFFTFILPLVWTWAFEPLGHKFPHKPVGTHRPRLLPKTRNSRELDFSSEIYLVSIIAWCSHWGIQKSVPFLVLTPSPI